MLRVVFISIDITVVFCANNNQSITYKITSDLFRNRHSKRKKKRKKLVKTVTDSPQI
ncbi:hypothetical protein Hanom_Chr09g00827131 [Helianthus anomalus]